MGSTERTAGLMNAAAACTFGTIAGPVLGGVLAMDGDHYAGAWIAFYLSTTTLVIVALVSPCVVAAPPPIACPCSQPGGVIARADADSCWCCP